MNYQKIINFIFITCLFTSINGKAQDIHFTQIFNSPATINPALAGFSNSRLRVFLNHRNQWAAVSVPFQTYNAALDGQIIRRKQKGDVLGIGFNAFSDKAGDSKFGTQQISMSLAFIKAMGNANRNILGFGVNGAFVQRSLDYTSLYFDNQYNGTFFNPALNSGEQFAVNNYTFFDISAGVNWFTNINYDINLSSGISVWHINRPMQSLMNDNNVKLSTKILFSSEAEISLAKSYTLLPMIFIASQGTYSEILLGTRFKYIVNFKQENYSAFTTGIFYRNKDAIAVYTGFDYLNMNFAISYDFNISKLKVASNYFGGLEISFAWKMVSDHKPKKKDLPCPIF